MLFVDLNFLSSLFLKFKVLSKCLQILQTVCVCILKIKLQQVSKFLVMYTTVYKRHDEIKLPSFLTPERKKA